MQQIRVTEKITGKIRELHGVNCAPYSRMSEGNQKLVEQVFTYAGVPRSRLHDVCGAWGGMWFVDVPNVFRNFDADPYQEENYDFHYTDEYITAIVKTGAKIVYRLGVTIEWGSKKYMSYPPRDSHKWAVICEHIIRHYNEGWADGFYYDIDYWEIWNEPENPPMWQGTKEDFFELYKVASLHLKEQFPQLKIGGYGSCGFYAAIGKNNSDFYRSFVTFFDEFLEMVKENHCPLDFYTWHIYTACVDDIRACARYVREKLDEAGFVDTESHLNEWNYGPEGNGFLNMETMVGASFCAEALTAMQEEAIDMAQYYVLSQASAYNGFLYLRTNEYTPVIHVFAAFDRLYRAGNQAAVVTEEDGQKAAVLAARTEETCLVLISNYNRPAQSIRLSVEGAQGKPVTVYELADGRGYRAVQTGAYTGEITVDCQENGVYYITVGEVPTKDQVMVQPSAAV